jgi:hypothetical protein
MGLFHVNGHRHRHRGKRIWVQQGMVREVAHSVTSRTLVEGDKFMEIVWVDLCREYSESVELARSLPPLNGLREMVSYRYEGCGELADLGPPFLSSSLPWMLTSSWQRLRQPAQLNALINRQQGKLHAPSHVSVFL